MQSFQIELLKLNDLKIKFTIVLNETDDKGKTFSTVSKFSIKGNEYLKVNSKGRIVFEYAKENKGNTWEAVNQIGFTRPYFYMFLRKLKLFQTNFQIPELFGYGKGHRLIVNKELSESRPLVMQTSNRACTMEYCVVQDLTNQEVEYEGCVLKINRASNAILITYDELCSLVDMMDRIDFDALTMQAVVVAKLYEQVPPKQLGGASQPHIIYQAPIQERTEFRAPSMVERPNLFP